MAAKTTLLRAVTVVSILILHPLLITSHTLRNRSDNIDNPVSQLSTKNYYDKDDEHISTKILTKLLPSTNSTNSTSTSSGASPMACIPQENTLKSCYNKLKSLKSVNVVKCSQCLYGNFDPSTQIITCQSIASKSSKRKSSNSDNGGGYCSSVAGCMEGLCPKDCADEFYGVLNCIWAEAGCAEVSGGCAAVKKKGEGEKKKKIAVDHRPQRSVSTAATVATSTSAKTAATTAASSSSNNSDAATNPCNECSTSNGGTRNNFCGNLHTSPLQDVCSSQTECKERGLKCQVCTSIVTNDGYGGKSVVEDVGSGAHICVKDDMGEGGGDDKAGTTTTTATKAASTSSSSSSNTKKKQKGAGNATTTTPSSTGGKKKSSTTTPYIPSERGYCYSRAVVLGNCIYSKDASPDCLKCIKSGTQKHASNPTCTEVKQSSFCTNIANCASEQCGKCSFEFYAGFNCALQKIKGCAQFSCAIGEGTPSGGWQHVEGDGYSLQQFQDEVERQYQIAKQQQEEEEDVVVIRESF